jgi:hypothetical protein
MLTSSDEADLISVLEQSSTDYPPDRACPENDEPHLVILAKYDWADHINRNASTRLRLGPRSAPPGPTCSGKLIGEPVAIRPFRVL